MHMSHQKALITLLLLLLGLFGAAALPSQQFGDQPPGPPPDGPRGNGIMFLWALDLTDAQKSQIKAIMDSERSSTEAIAGQLRDARKTISDATLDGQFDEQRIRSLAAVEAQLQVEMTVARARRQAAVYKILTEEQQAKLKDLRANGPGFLGFPPPARP